MYHSNNKKNLGEWAQDFAFTGTVSDFPWNRDVAEKLWSRSDILSLDPWATRNSPFKPESLLFPLAERCRMTVCQACQSPWNSLADSILILLVLLKAITRVLSKDESISHLHLSWKCLIRHWLLACTYKEGSSLGKLLGLSFNGYSQPALCHYWPTLSWASSQICDIIRPFSALHHTLFLPPHYTTESYALFNKTDCQRINIRQHNSIIQQPNANPSLNSKRDFRVSQRWAARKLKGAVGWGAFECFT